MSIVTLTARTAEALSNLGIGDFNGVEQPERMAWVVLVLRKLKDQPIVFPRGKWATIQEIERQLDHAAVERASKCTLITGATEDGA
jgi:hypothetical protein